MAIAKMTDSGLGVFVIIGATVLGLAFILTRDLDSKDRLEFLKNLTDNRAFAWGGWIVAAAVIWLARWLLRKERNWYERELARVDEVKEKALQANLDLLETKPQK